MSPPDREGQSGVSDITYYMPFTLMSAVLLSSQEPPSETGPSGETESVISADQESLTSQYAAAYGRPYYSAGNIFLPFDETEQRRLDSLHRLLRVCLDGELTVVS